MTIDNRILAFMESPTCFCIKLALIALGIALTIACNV